MATCYCFQSFMPLPFRRFETSCPLRLPKFQCYPSTLNEGNPSKISASLKKPRVSRRAKSNDELVRDIRDFLSSVGLPEDHFPSMKVLTQHGRQDLAHIVRRRGYKFITQLLETPIKGVSDMGSTEPFPAGNLGQDERLGVLAGAGTYEEMKLNASTEKVENIELQEEISFSSPSLDEAVAKFIEHGELETLDELVCNESGTRETNNSFIGRRKINGSVSVEHDISENISAREVSSVQDTEQHSGNKDLDIEHQKELELIDLKQQIEKEKGVLSALQVEAETKIQKSQELVSQKELELRAVEENLDGLVETVVQFSIEGEIVELAGSFNGWCYKINMVAEPTPTRGCRVWRTVLWLYPGIYEIKFVVDGIWMTDPERELVFRNNIQNNVLRIY